MPRVDDREWIESANEYVTNSPCEEACVSARAWLPITGRQGSVRWVKECPSTPDAGRGDEEDIFRLRFTSGSSHSGVNS